MVLSFQSIVSLFLAEDACASLIFMSLVNIPSLVCVDPKYVSGTTSSNAFPFIHILVDDHCLMLLTRILLFVGANFHGISSSNFRQPFGELLVFSFTASEKTNCKVTKHSSAFEVS